MAEAMTILVGLGKARRRGRAVVLMEGGNQGVMKALQGKIEMPWEAEVMAHSIQQVMVQFISIEFIWVKREFNSMANGVA